MPDEVIKATLLREKWRVSPIVKEAARQLVKAWRAAVFRGEMYRTDTAFAALSAMSQEFEVEFKDAGLSISPSLRTRCLTPEMSRILRESDGSHNATTVQPPGSGGPVPDA